MISLVPLSGGIDSTYVLAKLLRETDDQVLALHIRMGNRERRWKAEDLAAKRIVAYCRSTYRDFELFETTVDRRQLSSFGLDVLTVSFQSGLLHRHLKETRGQGVDRYLMGYCLEDLDRETHNPNAPDRLKLLASVRGAASGDPARPQFDTVEMLSKAGEMRYLGEELTSLCWTCREPVMNGNAFAECGVCVTCGMVQTARDQIAMSETMSG